MNLRSKWPQTSLHYPVQIVFRQRSLCWKDRKWVLTRSNTTLWANAHEQQGWKQQPTSCWQRTSLLLLSHSPCTTRCQQGGDSAPFTSLKPSSHLQLWALRRSCTFYYGLALCPGQSLKLRDIKSIWKSLIKIRFYENLCAFRVKIYPPKDKHSATVFLTWWDQLHGESFLHLKDSPRLEAVKDARNKNNTCIILEAKKATSTSKG